DLEPRLRELQDGGDRRRRRAGGADDERAGLRRARGDRRRRAADGLAAGGDRQRGDQRDRRPRPLGAAASAAGARRPGRERKGGLMHPIEYASPQTREQAVRLLGSDPAAAAPLAGGSDLLALLKSGVETPKRLVNLKEVAGLTGVRSESGGLRIGALTVLDDLAADAALGFEYPAVTASAGRLAGPQIRNVATLGGNLLQRPRCWYYRNGFGLLALRDGKSMVVEGDYRYHAILGNEGPAYFVSPSTLAPV